ncbi:hypothetical protein [uncultured Dokdonia sp.]|uniref:hypothetical protein n=1 Tax=uncultured Dokdonia sp. TaxID=575653 RepID=UPI0026084B79|nr:hypothetical protein [uncultured Dokdonia sp.]
MIKLKLGEISEFDWIQEGVRLALSSNLICITKPEFEQTGYSPLQWFGTNVIQEIAKKGNTEICPLFGEHIKSINDYCYQLCRSIPWGFEMGRNSHAIYDVLLNFETEPENRIFIWYDCQTLFKKDKKLFKEIFERMIVAGYLNSIGESTSNYQVNQKNIFMFRDTQIDELTALLEKEYYTPKVSMKEEFYMKHEFEILELK